MGPAQSRSVHHVWEPGDPLLQTFSIPRWVARRRHNYWENGREVGLILALADVSAQFVFCPH